MKSPILLDSTYKSSMYCDPTRLADQPPCSRIFEHPISWVGLGRVDEISVEYAGIAGSGRPVCIPSGEAGELIVKK